MIRRLKFKFILLAMTALVCLLTLLLAGMNLLNYNAVVSEADTILAQFSQNGEGFPDINGSGRHPSLPSLSPEPNGDQRYFSVLLPQNGGQAQVDSGRFSHVDTSAAVAYAEAAYNSGKDSGFVGNYRFCRTHEASGIRLSFLDCGRELNAFYDFLYIGIGIALAGLIVVFIIITVLSDRIIRPIAESYEKQKRFITDAGHEMKTPLTIISANVDVLEMETGTNDYLEDIRQQTKRLSSLTNDLTFLARMEETQQVLTKIDFPLSDVTAETVDTFKAPLRARGLTLQCFIQPMLTLHGSHKALEQLIGILMDNALKYTADGGTVTVGLSRQGRQIRLWVSNPTTAPVSNDELAKVFERFYRTDPSRNSQTGGHGIGLSIAKAIADAHGGKIQAYTADGRSFTVCVTFYC